MIGKWLAQRLPDIVNGPCILTMQLCIDSRAKLCNTGSRFLVISIGPRIIRFAIHCVGIVLCRYNNGLTLLINTHPRKVTLVFEKHCMLLWSTKFVDNKL